MATNYSRVLKNNSSFSYPSRNETTYSLLSDKGRPLYLAIDDDGSLLLYDNTNPILIEDYTNTYSHELKP